MPTGLTDLLSLASHRKQIPKSEKKGEEKHRNTSAALLEGEAADGGGLDPKPAPGTRATLRIVFIK